jgi:hypothetical protein
MQASLVEAFMRAKFQVKNRQYHFAETWGLESCILVTVTRDRDRD